MTTMLFFCDLDVPESTDQPVDHACELQFGHDGACSCECDTCQD